eukprot:gene2419-4698_t
MADMLAGHFFTRICNLPGVVTADRALSCYKEIYSSNVINFGRGSLLGAVNGMREVWTGTTYALAAGMIAEATYEYTSSSSINTIRTTTTKYEDIMRSPHNNKSNSNTIHTTNIINNTSNNNNNINIINDLVSPITVTATDNSPLLENIPLSSEAEIIPLINNTNTNINTSSSSGSSNNKHIRITTATSTVSTTDNLLTDDSQTCYDDEEQRRLLVQMGLTTAQGIHDGGWRDFGYWFATPEGWEQSGNYRSLGYMRPLSIWAMQFAMNIQKRNDMKL